MLRLQVRIEYDSWWSRPERLWFEVPSTLEKEISFSGDPWLTALLPLAISLNEPLTLEAAITPLKRKNAQRTMAIWSEWFPKLKPIPIHAPEMPGLARAQPGKIGSFFSGGLDTFFTVYHDRESTGGSIDELIFIHGADLPIDDIDSFQTVYQSIRHTAKVLQLPLISVATNLRQTRFEEANYNRLSHGSLLGAIGLVLEARFRQLLISSNWSRMDIRPLGSHCDTDPLLSNENTEFVYYGEWLNRIEKTEFLSRYPFALDNIRVCWQPGRTDNCGRCLKCLRTMTALEILGALARSGAFNADRLDLDLLRKQLLSEKPQYFEHLQRYAQTNDRSDIADAIQAGFDRTRRIERALFFGIIPQLRSKLYMRPWARRWVRPISRPILRLINLLFRKLP